MFLWVTPIKPIIKAFIISIIIGRRVDFKRELKIKIGVNFCAVIISIINHHVVILKIGGIHK